MASLSLVVSLMRITRPYTRIIYLLWVFFRREIISTYYLAKLHCRLNLRVNFFLWLYKNGSYLFLLVKNPECGLQLKGYFCPYKQELMVTGLPNHIESRHFIVYYFIWYGVQFGSLVFQGFCKYIFIFKAHWNKN